METAIEEKLLKTGHRFSFYQAVRLLHALTPGAPRLGEGGPAHREAIRLRPAISQAFPVADIAGIDRIPSPAGDSDRFQVTVRFFGLYGTVTPLPLFYTESIADPDDSEAQRVRRFLDLFHHRLLSLLYRGWLKYRYAMQFLPGAADGFSRRLLPLTGMSDPSPLEGIPKAPLLRYLGLMTQLPRSAAGLRQLLTGFLGGIPVRIVQCVHRWVPVNPEKQNALGARNSSLGADLVLGERVPDRTGRFRVVVGPLDYETFVNFTPAGEQYGLLRRLVRLFVMDPLEFELELILKGEAVPEMQLGPESLVYLGWTGWVISEPSDDVSVVFGNE